MMDSPCRRISSAYWTSCRGSHRAPSLREAVEDDSAARTEARPKLTHELIEQRSHFSSHSSDSRLKMERLNRRCEGFASVAWRLVFKHFLASSSKAALLDLAFVASVDWIPNVSPLATLVPSAVWGV